ncbi:MAG: RpiB/LacA/LacB family sugar-phosphate isomerase [Polyangiaceae bacterium]|jgi:ribose 5-phosphate isomerase B
MRIAFGSDERTFLTAVLTDALRARGYDVVLFGAIAEGDEDVDWPLVSAHVGEAVASGQADQGIVCCWTGTGASIAANKIRGIRAALCADAETAKGARTFNHANVLALSLRATSEGVAKEILQAWFATDVSVDEWNMRQVERIAVLEAARCGAVTPGGA